MNKWFLVHAQTKRELLAEENLRRQGYETFLPFGYRSVRRARRRQTVRDAYFPGYLFVSLNLAQDRWRPINSTTGVLRLVVAQETPIAVPQEIIDGLRRASDSDGVVDLAQRLRSGDPVRVTLGPFADQLGRVDSVRSADRIVVLLELMQQSVRVEIPRRSVTPIASL